MFKLSGLAGLVANTKTRAAQESELYIEHLEREVKLAMIDPSTEISGVPFDVWLKAPAFKRGAKFTRSINKPSKLRLIVQWPPVI